MTTSSTDTTITDYDEEHNVDYICTLSISPSIPSFLDPVTKYKTRTDSGSYTYYTFNDKVTALIVKKNMEMEGYIVHFEDDKETMSTKHTTYYDGMKLGTN